jgi:tetratricopeptide (TPR) repeat protein
MDRHQEVLASCDEAIALAPDRAELYNRRGIVLQEMERFDDALADYDKAIALNPGYVAAHNNRGVILFHLRRYEAAVASCDIAIGLRPDAVEPYNNRGVALHELGRYDDALASYGRALALKPDCAEVLKNRGATLQQLAKFDEAITTCDRAIALKPDYVDAYQIKGLCLVSKGDMPEAERMFLRALGLKPDFTDPIFSLTQIRRYRDQDDADAKRIRTLLDSPGISLHVKDCLYFSLGKIYDDCRLYDEAFECYREGNRLRNSAVSYKPARVAEFTDGIIEVFSGDFLARPFVFASDSESPLFIVRMPRSGTTLMAQILSNHRAIGSAGELPTILDSISRLPELIGTGVPYPFAAKDITPTVAARLIDDYEKRLRRDSGAEVGHVIDKHPLNFRHLGFIVRLFPRARIIHCTRDPLDTGLSNYFQRFTLPYDYSFDLRNIGHFYREYLRIMEHWRRVLLTPLIEVSYEDMILKTEKTARATLDALGLEWDPNCLAPHTNPHAVDSASNWQVRQPIHSQSIGRWRHYEKYLTPLKESMLPHTGDHR